MDEVEEQPGPQEDIGWFDERPRKPTDDLTAYVKGVGGSLGSALDADERAALVRNVFEELEGNEASLACSRATAGVLETLFGHASAGQLHKALFNVKRYFGFLCTNRQASHVMQSLLARAHVVIAAADAPAVGAAKEDSNKGGDGEGEDDDDDEEGEGEDDSEEAQEGRKALVALIDDLCKTIVTKELWWDMMFDPCATHVVRSLLLLLAAQDPAAAKGKKKASGAEPGARAARRAATLPSFSASLHAFLSAVSKWQPEDVKKACTDIQASPVVQLVFAHSLPKHKAWKAALARVLCPTGAEDAEPTCDPAVVLDFAKDRVASHVMQVVVAKCDNETYNDLVFEQFLRGRMSVLCAHPVANFVLQHALASVRTPAQLEQALDELEPELCKTLLRNRMGVVWRLCEAARLGDKALQSRVCRAVVRGVRARGGRGGSGNAVEMLLELSKPKGTKPQSRADGEEEEEEEEKAAQVAEEGAEGQDGEEGEAFSKVCVSVLGAKIAGSLLRLAPEAVRVLLESLASMEASSLVACCVDPVAGRHVMEALMDTPASAGWAKQRILLKLKESLVKIATNKFGCHVVRKAYDGGSIKDRMVVAKALSKKERKVSGSRYGAYLHRHCRVALFARHPDQWKAAAEHDGHKKRKAALDGLLDDLDRTHAKLAAAPQPAAADQPAKKKSKTLKLM